VLRVSRNIRYLTPNSIYRLVAALAVPGFGTILVNPKTHSRRLFAGRADELYIRDMNGRFTLNPADLCTDVAGATLMFDDEVDALHDDPIFVRVPGYLSVMAVDLVPSNHTMHCAPQGPSCAPGYSGIPTGDNFNRIAPFYPFHESLLPACRLTGPQVPRTRSS
jgi:hypothetical protein